MGRKKNAHSINYHINDVYVCSLPALFVYSSLVLLVCLRIHLVGHKSTQYPTEFIDYDEKRQIKNQTHEPTDFIHKIAFVMVTHRIYYLRAL